jgi:hypothetical protein
MTNKSTVFWKAFLIIVPVVLYSTLLYFAWKETGTWTVVNLVFCMVAIELLSFAIGLNRKMIVQSNKNFADFLPVFEGIVNEIAELKKVRMNATMTVSSVGVGPIDPNTPLAKKQEGM